MPKSKPIIHTQLEDTSGQQIGDNDEIELSDGQLDWLAALFAPIVEESFKKRGESNGVSGAGTDRDCNCA